MEPQRDLESDHLRERHLPKEHGVSPEMLGVGVSKHLLDKDLTVLWANAQFCNDAGYTKEEFLSQFSSLRRYYEEYPVDFELLRNKLRHLHEGCDTKASMTCRMPVKGGGFSWVRVSARAADDLVSGVPVLCLTTVNVDDMISSENEKKQYFEFMMEEYAGNIYISDMDTYELLYLNQNSCNVLGGRKKDFLGRKCYEVIQGRSTPCPFCNNSRLTREDVYEWEFFNPVLDRTFLIKNREIDWNGHRARLELSHDTYSVEYKLAQKDRERDAMVRSVLGGVARLDARDFSTILWYGADFLSLIGYTKEQFENELDSKCSYIHPDDMAAALKVLKEIKQTGQKAVIEARVITRSGKIRILTITLRYVSGEESWDGIPSFYTLGFDVTDTREEQMRQRKALEEAYQSLRIANAAKTSFLSSMSHDIRTPMNAIVGMTAIAQANLHSPEKVDDCLNKINVSSRHLLSLISEVLDMSKIESGRIDLVPEDVDLSELIQNIYDICKPLVAEKKQELRVTVGQVSHERVVVDRNRLQQVFMNLLSNAIKYTPEGGKISLAISELPSLIPQKGWFEFVFTDNGIGMSADFIPKIFDPFSRAEDPRVCKIHGTGLGMAITENIIQMMNGTIKVESEKGVGSRFTVSVPLQLQMEEDILDEELIGLPVLVVDDDQIICENAMQLLSELGMRGYWVLSGEEAVRRLEDAHGRADDFFAVILDWKMPGMDGLETLKVIRERLGNDVPIIIISAYDYSDIEEEFVRAGADAFISKPLFKSKILHVLRLFCSKNRLEKAGVLMDAPYPSLCGKRVLLAEDNELNKEIAVELLGMKGISVDHAENGALAVERFRESAPGYYAAILMDIQMPVMDGYEAAAAIRALPRKDAADIPILALTANAFVSDIGKAQSSGMNDHISKPIDIDRLAAVLSAWIK
ncbi:response regulator [uncultured Cloacibacillus sp.]|uniref:response regulator n=1 Tax=uncultured Cloacibacillus sp. TaxID=889794 RepID=UPI00258D69A3|nr:response regulator [uncultured Cloacibacillus sp.]